jgi:hypothetical protein
MERNEDTFRAVHQALAEGDAVGIFPEGVSHSEPALVPLRTGAARIALGALARTGAPFPIVPVGLVFRRKDVFRSEVTVYTGRPVRWDDLAGGAEPAAGAVSAVPGTDAVRELTARVQAGLRQVTLNLARWEDRPLVECAVRIWESERGAPPTPAERVRRLEVTTRLLDEVRRGEDAAGLSLARDVSHFCARLRRLRLRPADLVADIGLSRGVRWAAARLHLVMPLAGTLVAAAALFFWLPYRLTAEVVGRLRLEEDLRSTWKLLLGLVLHLCWLAGLVAIAAVKLGWMVALAAAFVLPAVGIGGVLIRERWRWAWGDARRFFLLRSRRALVEMLRARQRELAVRLDALYARLSPRVRAS